VSEEVRAQINLPAEQGVLVRLVVPKGPAAQAGIEQFDIILTANGKPVVTGLELMELVQQAGASGDKITLDVLRRGEHKSIELTPAERPASDDAAAGSGQGWGSGGAMTGMPGMPNFGPGGPHLRMRVPGSALGQGMGLNQMPNNFSVSVQKNNDEPAHITVKRGNDTWEVVGDDPKSLEQLPDDVRPYVEQMLSGGSTVPLSMPGMPGMNRMRGVDRMPGMWGPTGFDNDAMQQQLQRMEQQLQQMRLQLQQDLAPQGQPSSPILPKEPDDSTDE
jgi:hypothetical protein